MIALHFGLKFTHIEFAVSCENWTVDTCKGTTEKEQKPNGSHLQDIKN